MDSLPTDSGVTHRHEYLTRDAAMRYCGTCPHRESLLEAVNSGIWPSRGAAEVLLGQALQASAGQAEPADSLRPAHDGATGTPSAATGHPSESQDPGSVFFDLEPQGRG